MDKKNILPTQGKPVIRMNSGQFASPLAELSEEALGGGVDASGPITLPICSYDGVDASGPITLPICSYDGVDASGPITLPICSYDGE